MSGADMTGVNDSEQGAQPPAEQVVEGEVAPQLSPREQMLNAIAANAQAKRAAELAYGEDIAAEARARANEFERDQGSAASEADAGARAAASAAAANRGAATPAAGSPPAPEGTGAQVPAVPVEQHAAPTHVPVVIDGRQYMVTPVEAAQLATNSHAVARQLEQRVQHPPQQVQAAPAAPVQKPVVDDEAARTFIRNLTYGDESQQIEAVRGLVQNVLATAPGPQINPNQIARQAADIAIAQTQYEANLQNLAMEYLDIFDNPDPTYAELAALKVNQLRGRAQQLGLQKSDMDLYREACSHVRSTALRGAEQSQPGAVPDISASQAAQANPMLDRAERKRAAPQIPSGANRTASFGADQKRPPTGSEIVSKMRRDRGQQLFN